MALCKEEHLSDEEVFFGKLTLKELKKHILWDKQRQPWSISTSSSPVKNVNDPNESLKIIQTQSQPNLISVKGNYDFDSPATDSPCWFEKVADDSFDKMENMVEKLCLSPHNNEKTELNNTLEVIEYILNNPPKNGDVKAETVFSSPIKNEENKKEFVITPANPILSIEDAVLPSTYVKLTKEKVQNMEIIGTPKPKTPLLKSESGLAPKLNNYTTPTNSNPVFKTPAKPLSHKKPSVTSLKKTPNKTNTYQHICSPVASYIKNCPTVPLVKDVHPKKPLPGPSSIPKFVKSQSTKPSYKENVVLPSVAYRSAKKTKVIDIPDENKLPESQWAKKITSTLPKPMVMKHNYREINLAKKVLIHQQEDSFADLTYHQADVSVCTQKSAFKPK